MKSLCLTALLLALIAAVSTPARADEPARHAQIYLDELGDEESEGDEADDPDQVMRPDVKEGIVGADPPQSAQETKQNKLDLGRSEPPLLNPLERPKMLAHLYEQLSAAKSAEAAEPIVTAIEHLWVRSGSATVDLLMARAEHFAKESDLDLALEIIDALVDIAPDSAEAWYLRAKVNSLRQDHEHALADLRRTLSLDPKHYKAINDLGRVLEDLGAKKEALEAYRKALAINPFLDDTRQTVESLTREVEGQDI